MFRGHCVKNEIEAANVLLHLGFVPGDNNFVGSETNGVIRLVWGCGEKHYVGAERLGKFHSHVAQTAKTNDSHLLPFIDIPVPQG